MVEDSLNHVLNPSCRSEQLAMTNALGNFLMEYLPIHASMRLISFSTSLSLMIAWLCRLRASSSSAMRCLTCCLIADVEFCPLIRPPISSRLVFIFL